jgi:predicted DsbA family dithiol-disulfide isomerase
MKVQSTLTLLLLLLLAACNGQTNTLKVNATATNPLLCNPEKGLCEMPDTTQPNAANSTQTLPKPLRIVYFTDPICSSCWGIEPQLRRLKLEYGAQLDIEYRMGGLLPSWDVYNSGGISKPSDVAGHWDEVSHHYDMPIDGDVWLEDPLPSSYPPSVAFKAAQMQDPQLALKFLRRIREMVFLEKKNITKWEHLAAAAEQVGLNATQLKTDFEGAAQQAFQDDLTLARSQGVRGFPTLFVSDTTGNRLTLYGVRPYAQFEQTLQTLHPDVVKSTFDPSPEALFAHYPTLTAREFSVLSGQPRAEAEQTLNTLTEKQKLSKVVTKNGALWVWKKP